MLTFRKRYFLLTIVLLLVEVAIAFFVHDRLIRPYGGDALAAVLLYCLLRSFVPLRACTLAATALALAYLIEGLQYVDLLGRLGLHHSRLARVVLGSAFSWLDLLAYTIGIGLVIVLEKARPGQR